MGPDLTKGFIRGPDKVLSFHETRAWVKAEVVGWWKRQRAFE